MNNVRTSIELFAAVAPAASTGTASELAKADIEAIAEADTSAVGADYLP